MVKLSKRLERVAGLVTRGAVTADVGCDHGYTSIFLVRQGVCSRAIAMDVNAGPLKRAKEHIKAYGLLEYIETRLSFGLEALVPGEAESIVIAGMGGATMEKILTRGREAAMAAKELILQPQSELFRFREFLESDYVITAEDMVKEDGKFYPMMRAVPKQALHSQKSMELVLKPPAVYGNAQGPFAHMEKQYGPLLLKERHPVLLEYLKWREEQLEQVRIRLAGNATPEIGLKRGEELRLELAELRQALRFF